MRENLIRVTSHLALGFVAIMNFGMFGNDVAFGQQESVVAEIIAASKRFADAFNSGSASDAASLFTTEAEVIDEQGNVHQGQNAVKELLTKYFEKFPGVRMEIDVESIRVTGAVAIEEGTRVTTTRDGNVAQVSYMAVLLKSDKGWRIASIRDSFIEIASTPGELLKSLDWLIGDWINEGADARVQISYKWSEDGNYILGDISVMKSEQLIMNSSQRIGWDPLTGKPRSWMFDSDGGFSESSWTQLDGTWSVDSKAVTPNGLTGTANVTISIGENGRYTMKGSNRIVGNVMEDDYEITIVKQPPAPKS